MRDREPIPSKQILIDTLIYLKIRVNVSNECVNITVKEFNRIYLSVISNIRMLKHNIEKIGTKPSYNLKYVTIKV